MCICVNIMTSLAILIHWLEGENLPKSLLAIHAHISTRWIVLTSLLTPSDGSNRFLRQDFPFQNIHCVCGYRHIFWHVFVNHIPFFCFFQCLPDLQAWCLLMFTGTFLNNFFAIFLSLDTKTVLNKRSNTTWFGYLLSMVSNLLHKQWDCRIFISFRKQG